MTFARPELLWLALLPALALAGCTVLLRRRRASSERYRRLLVGAPAGARPWQRHLSPLLLVIAAGLMLFATAGPQARLDLPSEQRTIVLAIDASGSMMARDIEPSRIAACQAAARSLVAELPRNVRVGIVAYADNAQLVQPPTLQHDAALAAIDRIVVDGGTAIGDGVVVALAAIFPDQGIVAPGPDAPAPPPPRGAALAPGAYRSAAIVLLSDGQNSAGTDPQDAARTAAQHGVKVYTVGFGTAEGVLIGPEYGGVMVRLDEDALRKIAEATGARYFRAASAHELRRVYQGLESHLEIDDRPTDLTAPIALLAALLVALGAGASLWWYGRIA